jgi:Uma2 family endonuclease
MTAGVLVSLDEYLRTSYRPDCDYVDGQLVERNVGERKHSKAQRKILYYIGDRYPELRERVFPEQRVQVKPKRFRVPDICLAAENAPEEEVFVTAPSLCIEILSPEDTLTRTLERIRDYLEMGVPVCWILDPVSGQTWTAKPGRLEDTTDGVLRASGIEMPVAEVLD